MRTALLPLAVPRDPKLVRQSFDIGHLLRPRLLVGWLFVLSGLFSGLPMLLLSLAGKSDLPLIGALSFQWPGPLGLWMVMSASKLRRRRLRALTHGQPWEGRVIRHGMAIGFGILLRRLDTRIVVVIETERGPVEHAFDSPLPGLRERFPIGSSVVVLLDPLERALLVPAEFDVTIEWAR